MTQEARLQRLLSEAAIYPHVRSHAHEALNYPLLVIFCTCHLSPPTRPCYSKTLPANHPLSWHGAGGPLPRKHKHVPILVRNFRTPNIGLRTPLHREKGLPRVVPLQHMQNQPEHECLPFMLPIHAHPTQAVRRPALLCSRWPCTDPSLASPVAVTLSAVHTFVKCSQNFRCFMLCACIVPSRNAPNTHLRGCHRHGSGMRTGMRAYVHYDMLEIAPLDCTTHHDALHEASDHFVQRTSALCGLGLHSFCSAMHQALSCAPHPALHAIFTSTSAQPHPPQGGGKVTHQRQVIHPASDSNQPENEYTICNQSSFLQYGGGKYVVQKHRVRVTD